MQGDYFKGAVHHSLIRKSLIINNSYININNFLSTF